MGESSTFHEAWSLVYTDQLRTNTLANLGYILGGGGPVIKKYMVRAGTPDFTVAGCPAIAGVTAQAGVAPQSVGTISEYVGLSLDTAVYTTTQSTVLADGPGIVSLVVNADPVIRLRMSGTAAAGGALPLITNLTASSGGTAVTITTGDIVPDSPTMLDGTIICLTGSNAGLRRKITTVSSTVFTVVVPFPYAIAVGDTFTAVPYFPGAGTAVGGDGLTLTTAPGTNATEADATVATTTLGVRYASLDLQYDINSPSRGRLDGFLYAKPVRLLIQPLA